MTVTRAFAEKENQNVCSFVSIGVYPFLKQQILNASKLKAFADDNFRFDENGSKVSGGLKTLWEKEKLLITAISPFPTVFSKDFYYR